jgi:hypothetical protein
MTWFLNQHEGLRRILVKHAETAADLQRGNGCQVAFGEQHRGFEMDVKEVPEHPAAPPPPFDIFTIGHSNHPIDRFIALLKGASLTAVVDVRSQPFSRRHPWFSANRLRANLEQTDIAYVSMGDALGGRPRGPALFRDGVADYEAIARTPEFRAGIDRVVAATKNSRPCLMCAEREPLDCHRCLLVAPALVARGLRIGHVLADGSVMAHGAIEERLLALAGSGDLFAGDVAARLADAYRRRAKKVAFRARA